MGSGYAVLPRFLNLVGIGFSWLVSSAGLRDRHLWRPWRGGENTGMNSGHHHCHTTLYVLHNSILKEPNVKDLYVPHTTPMLVKWYVAAWRKSIIWANTTRRAITYVGDEYVHTRDHWNGEPPNYQLRGIATGFKLLKNDQRNARKK